MQLDLEQLQSKRMYNLAFCVLNLSLFFRCCGKQIWGVCLQTNLEQLQSERDDMEKEFEEIKRQLEEDTDKEIEEMKER